LKKKRKPLDSKIPNRKRKKNQKIYGDPSHLSQKRRRKNRGIRIIGRTHRGRAMD
jgi:hypothetical protein